MKKTKKMKEVEEEYGEPIEELLERLYWKEYKSTAKIGELWGMSSSGIEKWMKRFGIKRRKMTTGYLKEGIKKPGKKKLKELYEDEWLSSREIGKKYKVHEGTIRNWMRRYGIEIRDKDSCGLPKDVEKPSKEELYKMYWEKGMSSNEIGEKVGVCGSTIINWLKKYDIRRKTKSEAGLSRFDAKITKKPSKEELEEKYIEEHKSSIEIGKELGVSGGAVLNWLQEYGISRREAGRSDLPKDFEEPTKEELERLYKETQSCRKIGEMFGVSSNTIQERMKKYGIQIEKGVKGDKNPMSREEVRKKLPKKRKWYSVKRYEKVMRLRERGLSARQISEKTEIPRCVVSDWIYRGRKPQSVRDKERGIPEDVEKVEAPYTEEDYNRVMKIREKTGWGNLRISRMTGINAGTVSNWIYEGGEINKKHIDELAEEKRYKLPKHCKEISPELGYILGVMIGDGNVKKSTLRLKVKDLDFAEAFKENVDKWLGNKKCGLRRAIESEKRKYWVVDVNSREVTDFLMNFDLLKIKNADDEVRGMFVRGFSDSDGGASKKNGITLSNTNLYYIKLIYELLDSLGIRISCIMMRRGKERWRNCYKIAINNRGGLNTYSRKVGFYIKRKQENLEYKLDSYVNYYPQRKEVEIPEYLRELEYPKEGLSLKSKNSSLYSHAQYFELKYWM